MVRQYGHLQVPTQLPAAVGMRLPEIRFARDLAPTPLLALIRDFGKRPRQIPPQSALRAPIHARYSRGITFQRVIVQG